MEFQVSLTPKARRDLEQIGRYIAQTDVETAYRFCEELLQEAISLHLIFYKIDEENRTVETLRFWHSSQSQNRLRLKEDPSRYFAAQPV